MPSFWWKRLKPEAIAAYPPPTVLSTSSNCYSCGFLLCTPLQIFLQLIPFLVIIFHLWSKPRGVFLRKMWRKSKSDDFSLYKCGGKVFLCQTHALTNSVIWKIAEARKFVFGLFYSHPQLLKCLIIISHVLAHECLNFHLFFSVQAQILAISPSHTLMENSVWLKTHFEQSALWSSLCRTNITLCYMAGQGLGIYCSDNQTAHGEKRTKGEEARKHLLKLTF